MSEEKLIYRSDEVLVRPDGSRRTIEEAIKLVGRRGVWLAQLHEEITAVLNKPKPLSVPTRIFISYRWGTSVQDHWVADVVSRLRALGNVVVHDRELQRQANPPSVPELVAQIASAHVFLAVIDTGYVERTGSWDSRSFLDGWVFDEWQTALRLQQMGKVKVLGLLREDTALPGGFTLTARESKDQSWRRYPGNTYDVRTPAMLESVLSHAFRYSGPSLTEQEWRRANAIYAQSQEALSSSQVDRARGLALALTEEYPQVPDGFAQLAHIAYRIGDYSAALSEARSVFEIDPDFIGVLAHAALSAYMVGQHDEAIFYGARALWVGADEAWAHFAVGNALDELLQVYPALAHLELARAALPVAIAQNDTGMAYRRAMLPENALICFEDGLKLPGADDNLRVNAVAAAIEAGNVSSAQMHLRALNHNHPLHAKLVRDLADWQQRGGPPPALMQRLKPRNSVGMVQCTHCKVQIPLISKDERLCVRCGAERVDDHGPCEFCEHDGEVIPALSDGNIRWGCPYCRKGLLTFAPH
ncbi:MAG: toll/interleukin-1 receptor domain-containing protein [Terracidiphilus sp.]|jgi:tetratricopeptide (TPR) repeat protein